MAVERVRVPNMNDTFMYTNKEMDKYPGFGVPPSYQPIQNVQPYDAKVGLDPFPPNVPQTTQYYENHCPLGTKYWYVNDSDWVLKDSRFHSITEHRYQVPEHPSSTHISNSRGFSHTGFLGTEFKSQPRDPRYNLPNFGNERPKVIQFETKNSNLLFNQ